jgi:Glycosyl transferase family 8
MGDFCLIQKSPILLLGRTDSLIQAQSVCSPQKPYRVSFMISWLRLRSSPRSVSLVRALEMKLSCLELTFFYLDQDLLAHFFKGKWKRLPYVYNSIRTMRVIHQSLWRDEDVRCLHYILNEKPWLRPRGSGGDYETVNGWWWDRFDALKSSIKETHPESLSLVEAQVRIKN